MYETFYALKITGVVMVRNFEVMFDKFHGDVDN